MPKKGKHRRMSSSDPVESWFKSSATKPPPKQQATDDGGDFQSKLDEESASLHIQRIAQQTQPTQITICDVFDKLKTDLITH